ncbi:hypothetical protein B0H14DRAFT_2631756 [Mycena olivaceomarginata]|nr:hypothetical protein B0H14DRAFT_2631756 [Mycena olivaceomarginata]
MHAAATGSRKTINSMSSQNAVHSKLLPVPNALLRIPEPPPPSQIPNSSNRGYCTEVSIHGFRSLTGYFQPHYGGGNRFTQADKDYFIKFLCWSLKQDPSLELLAEKVPHHNTRSWASHWSNNHDLPDKILASARECAAEASDCNSLPEEDSQNLPELEDVRDVTSSTDQAKV